MEQTIYAGRRSVGNLSGVLARNKAKRVFLVRGKKSYRMSHAENALKKIFQPYDVTQFYDFQLNPKIVDIQRGANVLRKNRCDFVVGVGGGSVIDIAKAVSVLACNPGEVSEYIRGRRSLNKRKLLTVAIPTTAGTGSESTSFSVVYIGKTKYSFANISILPDFAILDPTFTESMPSAITASTGMDALCQGVESFWSVKSTKESRKLSSKAMRLSISSLEKAVKKPDYKTRENMLRASNLAGQAINIAKTTAAHSISYPLTSFFNIPHGHAVSITIPLFFEFNYDVTNETLQDKRGVEFVKKTMKELFSIFNCETATETKQAMIRILESIGLETRLSNLDITTKDFDIIINNGFTPERVKNNPRLLTEAQLQRMLLAIL